MKMILWILFGAFAAWLASRYVGKRVGGGTGLSMIAGALGAVAAGCLLGSPHGFDLAAVQRVSTVLVGAVGILVMANLSTGGRLR